MELDIWVPGYNLAIEYQGEQHYHNLQQMSSSLALSYHERDKLKEEKCKDLNIRLVVVPYWWDQSLESLKELMN